MEEEKDENENKGYYAMKILKKKRVIDMKQTKNILNERQILANNQNPFLVKL